MHVRAERISVSRPVGPRPAYRYTITAQGASGPVRPTNVFVVVFHLHVLITLVKLTNKPTTRFVRSGRVSALTRVAGWQGSGAGGVHPIYAPHPARSMSRECTDAMDVANIGTIATNRAAHRTKQPNQQHHSTRQPVSSQPVQNCPVSFPSAQSVAARNFTNGLDQESPTSPTLHRR